MIFAVEHRLGVSLVRATTPEVAKKKALKQFGEHAAPYFINPDQEQEVACAQAMGARVLE